MLKLHLKPSEEDYEIELHGSFIPEKFIPSWFVGNHLIGKKEAKDSSIISVIKGQQAVFETKFLQVYTEKNRLRISTNQALSYDLVRDLGSSSQILLENALHNYLFINVRYHFTLKTNKEFRFFLNQLSNFNKWNDILDKPQVSHLRLNEDKTINKYNLKREISIFPCGREDMQKTIHIYIKNQIDLTSRSKSFFTGNNDTDIIDDSILTTNKILNSYL